MAKYVVGRQETIAIQGFLRYLQSNYSRKINPNDALLIAAISAVVRVESGSFAGIKYNNPFNLKSDPTSEIKIVDGKRRVVTRPGKLLRFETLAAGFRAMAKLLIRSPKASLLRVALNALKRGGNGGAVDFLAALAMSSFDAAHYGATDWLQAYDPQENLVYAAYLQTGSVQLKDPYTRVEKPPPPPPPLPRDFNYKVVVREYLDPYAAGRRYASRNARQNLATSSQRR